MEVFSKNELHLKQNKNDNKARKNRKELFSKIVKCHFDIEKDVLPLSNSLLTTVSIIFSFDHMFPFL